MDINILSQKYKVIENYYAWEKKLRIPYLFIKQLFFMLKNIRATDYIIISFGGLWALVPTLLGHLFKKPTLIILHGTGCVAFKEIEYGNIRRFPLKTVLRIAYKFASHLLPVSESLIYTENTYFSKHKVIKQGIAHFFPKNKTKKTVVGNVFDKDKWTILPNYHRVNNRFITVLRESGFKLKGGELIIKAAYKLPQFEFYFVGLNTPKDTNNFPSNVSFIPIVKPEKLNELYNTSKYYLQLSITEGFGCALCEAMLCGCIPIVSSVNSLPYIVNNTGYVLEKMDVNLLSNLLIKIHSEENKKLGEYARNRIIEKFSINSRKDSLYNILEEEKAIYNKP